MECLSSLNSGYIDLGLEQPSVRYSQVLGNTELFASLSAQHSGNFLCMGSGVNSEDISRAFVKVTHRCSFGIPTLSYDFAHIEIAAGSSFFPNISSVPIQSRDLYWPEHRHKGLGADISRQKILAFCALIAHVAERTDGFTVELSYKRIWKPEEFVVIQQPTPGPCCPIWDVD